MAWGLEARVPFLDRAFLDFAMNIDAKHKMFSKGTATETDEDGRPKMEKVIQHCPCHTLHMMLTLIVDCSTFSVRRSMLHLRVVRCIARQPVRSSVS